MMADAIRTHLVDSEGVLREYPPGSHPGQPALINNAYLIFSGVSPADRFKTLAAMNSSRLGNDGNPFHGLFIADSFFASGQTQPVLDYIRMYWGDMLRRGATTFWEHFSLDWPEDAGNGRCGSVCHGWSAGPTYPPAAPGVEATAQGFSKVRIAPQPGDLTWASGAVPTPLGPIWTRWNKADQLFVLEIMACPTGQRQVVMPAPGPNASAVHRKRAAPEKYHPQARPVIPIGSGKHQLVWKRLGHSLSGQ